MEWVDVVRRWVPRAVRYRIQRFVSLAETKRRWRARQDPLSGVKAGEPDRGGGGVRIGILRNSAQYHTHYVLACQEMGLGFQVLDLAASDWLAAIRASGCGLFMAWPEATQSHRAKLYKDRCALLEEELGYMVVPNSNECWVYEDKYRCRDWLAAREIPHPRTWLFLDEAEAREFAGSCDLPIVFKTGFGAAAAGVEIVRNRGRLRRIVRKAFGGGHVAAGHDHRDREWGRLLLQEYLPGIREWRMVRIGDSYFGHPKGQVGDFHSGSGLVAWDPPETRLLDLLHQVTEAGRFRSMDVDVFETRDGRLLVNELQTVFGASTSIDQMRVNGQAGRMVRSENGSWSFEPGDFARNACANARIAYAMEQLAKRTS